MGRTCSPSAKASTVTSGPVMHSSITTVEPDSPNFLSSIISRAAALALSSWVNVSYFAVGMWYFFINSLENALLASMTAALALGPKAGMPAFSRASTIPKARGSSGATTTKSMAFSLAQLTMPSTSVAFTATHCAAWAIPPLPGAQNSSVTLGDWASFQQMACSRPPEPTTKIFMKRASFYIPSTDSMY